MRHSNVLHRLLTLGKRNYPHHRGRVSLRASDGKLVKHTTEMILWSMILSLKCLGQSYDATSWESAGFMLSQTYYGNFAQWRYSNQWSNREVLLLLVENYTQCPAPTRWNTLDCGNCIVSVFLPERWNPDRGSFPQLARDSLRHKNEIRYDWNNRRPSELETFGPVIRLDTNPVGYMHV